MRRFGVTALCGYLLGTMLVLSCHQPKPPEQPVPNHLKALSPGEVAKTWNDALTEGDVQTAASLTSTTSTLHIKQNFGSLEQISVTYQRNLKGRNVETKLVHEEIIGDAAVVVYRVQYDDKAVKYWTDKLFREGGIWKIAPQFVQTTTLKE